MNRLLARRQATRVASLLLVCGSVTAGEGYAQQTIGGCTVLPANNIWNTPVDTLPVLSNSTAMVTTIGASRGFHADFGAGVWDGGPVGIPFITVSGTQPKYPATFTYADESDPGPYAVPLNAPIEGGSNATGDRHAIAVDTTNCLAYELYNSFPQSASWMADAGAIFDLRSNALRPSSWTSADAAGLPILPGLITYDEVLSGEIKHAIRFTAPQSRREFVWPARHYASSLTGTQYPRMGERFRLKASFDISTYPADVQVILRAMKKYGIMLADNGSAWYVSGKPDSRWNNDNLHTMGQLLGANFEAVDATVLRVDPDSGATTTQAAISVGVSPSSAAVRAGRAKTFAATVTGAPNNVAWSVNGIAGGDAVVGVIDAAGQYFAPTTVPNPATVTVRAASTTSPSSSGSSAVTILPLPGLASVSPSPVPAGSFMLTVNGAGFVSGSVVSFDGAALATTFVSAAQLRATGNAPAAKASVPVSVSTPDGEESNIVYVAISAPAAVTVTISPTTASVRINRTRQFSAQVQNGANTTVIWKVNGVAGGNPTIGTISSTGLYRAPAAVPQPAVVTVSATAAADQSKVASASVTITRR
jgi:hypothetical protein